MGMFKKFSWSTYDKPAQVLPNPNPKNYIVIRSQQVRNNLVIELQYPDCSNYEGRKILVYKDTTLAELIAQGSIDPHFCDNPRYKSPCARLEPTPEGWDRALVQAGFYWRFTGT